jgi:quercetin dioxygenase-like cupin family protein
MSNRNEDEYDRSESLLSKLKLSQKNNSAQDLNLIIKDDPTGVSYQISIHVSDERRFGDMEIKIINFKKDAPRAGHYHSSPEYLFVVRGSVLLKTKSQGKSDSEKELKLGTLEQAYIPGDVPHLIIGIEEGSEVLAIRSLKTQIQPDEEYKKTVEDYLRSNR